MKIRHEYSHLGGREIVQARFPTLAREVVTVVSRAKVPPKTKKSREKTMRGKMLYSPEALNSSLDVAFRRLGWKRKRVNLEISVPGLISNIRPFKEVDYFKNRIAAEVQFGKYFAMQYDLQKFQFFYNRDEIDAGIELVPMSSLSRQMSTGVSYYEMLVGDLARMGRTFPPVPVWVIGLDIT